MRSAHDRELPSAREIFAAAAAEAPVGCDVTRLSQVDDARTGSAGGNGTATPSTARKEEDEPMDTEAILRQAAARALEKQQKQNLRKARFAEGSVLASALGVNGDADEGDDAADDAADGGGGGRKRSAEDANDDYGMERWTTSSRATARSLVPKQRGSAGGGPNVEHARRGHRRPARWDRACLRGAGWRGGPRDGRRRSSASLLQRVGLRGRASQERALDFARRHINWEHGQPTTPWRLKLFHVQKSWWFQGTVLLCILASAYFLATEYPADPTKKANYLRTEIGLNAVFTAEFLVKVGALSWHYFRSGWNILDLVVLTNGWAIIGLSLAAPDRFVESLKILRLARVLRPLRALSIIPALREIINATLAAVRDLSSTLLIIAFFLTVFGTFLSALFSGLLRRRCHEPSLGGFYEPDALICSTYATVGRGCAAPNATCVVSGWGPYAELEGKAPFFIASGGHPARVSDTNPPKIPGFDNIGFSFLSVFVVWAGVGWTQIMYLVADAQGRGYESLFMLMHIFGAWVLVNLMVAALGTSFEREQANQRARKEDARKTRAMLLGNLGVDGKTTIGAPCGARCAARSTRASCGPRGATSASRFGAASAARPGRETKETIDMLKQMRQQGAAAPGGGGGGGLGRRGSGGGLGRRGSGGGGGGGGETLAGGAEAWAPAGGLPG